MEEFLQTIRPVFSGLLGALSVYLIIKFTKNSAKADGELKLMEYGLPFKIFTIILIPFSIFVVYAASHARESQIIIATIVASGFVLGALFSAYHVFFVKFSYDNDFVYYQSPFSKSKKAKWSALVDVGYSNLLQADYIVIEGIGRIWCPTVMNGYTELGIFLERKSQALFPEDNNS